MSNAHETMFGSIEYLVFKEMIEIFVSHGGCGKVRFRESGQSSVRVGAFEMTKKIAVDAWSSKRV